MRPFLVIVRVAVYALVVGMADSARADPIRIVAPADRTNVSGNVSNVIPFGLSSDSFRYQQVFAGWQFPSEPFLITSIAFRPEEGSRPSPNNSNGRSTIPGVQFTLSTTAKMPGALSGTFQENVGADAKIVFDGPFTFTTAATGRPGGPTDFDIVVDIHDFLYDPRLGNLLLDVSKQPFHWVTNSLDLDAQFADLEPGAPILTSRAYNYVDGTSAFALNTDNVGLVTQFSIVRTDVAPTPEPASILLFGSALAGLFAAQRRKRASSHRRLPAS
jgi:hypothetical protein